MGKLQDTIQDFVRALAGCDWCCPGSEAGDNRLRGNLPEKKVHSIFFLTKYLELKYFKHQSVPYSTANVE
jgi:hypothetical protein